MRPMLAFLVARTYKTPPAGYTTEKLMHAALALELLHTASLVHDDVVDQSDLRRGQASVNALYNNQAAVLVGDYILSLALCEAAHTGSPRFVEALAQLGKDLSDGELLQLHNMDCDDISEKQYYEVIRRKTASLFATCAAAGDFFGEYQTAPLFQDTGQQEQTHSQAYRLGELIGMIFQMRDDIFDLTGDAANDKPAGNDLHEGKLTLPVIHAVQCAPALKPAAMRVRRGEASEQDIDALTQAAISTGLPYAQQQMQKKTDEAHGIADQIAIHPEPLHIYIDYAAKRTI